MRDKIIELISAHPRHYTRFIKKSPDMLSWINNNSRVVSNNISEMIYSALHDADNTCSYGNKKKFISVNEGYSGCGPAATCLCARERVSQKVSQAKQSYTLEQKQAINNKRSETNLERYGVANSGQTAYSRSKHQEFYNNSELVNQTLDQMKKTMLERYGAENPQQVPSIREKTKTTLIEKYGADNINKTLQGRKRISQQSKKTWDRLKAVNFTYHKLNDKFRRLSNVEFVTSAADYKGTVGHIWHTFKCLNCNNIFDSPISCGRIPKCKICHPTRPNFRSQEENQVFDYLASLNITAYQRDRSIINPHELDIVCPDNRIAIEYCGLYWHSELSSGKLSDYHINKMNLCNQKGYRLITIFSDEWTLKQNIVKSKLAAIFNRATGHVNARSCQITTLTYEQSKYFYDQYHLQGDTRATTHLGLTFQNQIVAAMSFGKPRVFIKGVDAQYELIRYATATHVRGGAGRLLKHFEINYQPQSLVSYADARWSEGNMYKTLGFEKVDKKLTPGYWYTLDYTTREHRFNYTKHNLVKQGYNKSLTEWEIMQTVGYDRIWDCGQFVYRKIYR